MFVFIFPSFWSLPKLESKNPGQSVMIKTHRSSIWPPEIYEPKFTTYFIIWCCLVRNYVWIRTNIQAILKIISRQHIRNISSLNFFFSSMSASTEYLLPMTLVRHNWKNRLCSCWFKTLGASQVKFEIGPHTWRTRRDQIDRPLQIGSGRFTKPGTYWWACLRHHKMSRSPHPTGRILKYCIENLTGFRHSTIQMVSTTPYSLKATSLRTAPTGMLGRMYIPRKGVAGGGGTSNCWSPSSLWVNQWSCPFSDLQQSILWKNKKCYNIKYLQLFHC